jgi:hypothetical protein
MNAVAMSMPTLAAVLAFVTYSATGHELEPGIIFTSLTLFNLLRIPLMFLRASFHLMSDCTSLTYLSIQPSPSVPLLMLRMPPVACTTYSRPSF